jgi:molecular chaperone GrpE (heat shock protein)
MPKATLEFNLPEEEQEHRDAIDGPAWKQTVWDIDYVLRNKIKHADEHTPEIFVEALEMIRKELHDTLEHHKLILD